MNDKTIPVYCPGLTGDKIIGWATFGSGAMFDSVTVEITDDETLEWIRKDPETWHSDAAELVFGE